jgi:hypothetical protein
VPSSNATQAVEFDHEEFRVYFLGEGVEQIRPMNDRAKADVLRTLRRGVLPRQAQDALIRAITRDAVLERVQVSRFLLEVCRMDSQASYTQENCSDIIIRMISGVRADDLSIKGLAIGADALRDKKLSGAA